MAHARAKPPKNANSVFLPSSETVARVGEELIEELHSRQEPRLLRALEMVAPGTALREGIDNCVLARSGALIVIGDEDGMAPLLSGGIKLEIDYSPAMLFQLAKMDGAIALSQNATKIMWANVQLTPDPTILSRETGTRHRTAERVSKQTDALVISISERREVVTLFAGGAKYVLQEIPAVLARANQALATLDKYRARFDQVSMRLTALEFEGGVTLHDALTVLQRSEMVTRMAVEIERYIVELGAEGRLIEMQLEEMLTGLAADRSALVRDYIAESSEESFTAIMETLPRLPNQDLLDFGRLGELLGYDRKLNTLDFPVTPRGCRILGRIPRLPETIVQNVVREFGTFDVMLAATGGELESVEGVGEVRAKEIREGLRRLQEINLVDRYLQT
jgi:diadenylate cyclase